MNPLNVSIIPAQPGHELIFKGDRPSDFELRGQVLAWRITTWPPVVPDGPVRSEVEALDAYGELGEGYVGVVNPDNTVMMFGDRRYSDFDEFRAHSGCASLSKKRSWGAR